VKFCYQRRIKFYETDAMGIVHHANYLHLFEDARVELLRDTGFLQQKSLAQINYPLLESHVSYKKPLYFDDEIEVHVLLTSDQMRMNFQYEIRTKRYPEPAAFGKTTHIAMDMETRKPIRLPDVLKNLQ
jgi:acyl-CoA thioester hydrolase